MTDTVGTGASQRNRTPTGPARRHLTRGQILEAGLRLVDRNGLESLSMRKLAQELGVDPMTLYNHVENKDALLDGLAELLWAEIKLPSDDLGWEDMLRSIAGSLRGLARVHPHAYSLLLSRQVVPQSALRLSDVALQRLQRAGFERDQGAQIVCTTLAYAIGYGIVELSSLRLDQPGQAAGATTDLEQLMRIVQALPRGTPPRLVEVARLICGCDMDVQFTFGLDLLLRGVKDLGVEATTG